jgi:hypothetical protein
MKILKPGSVVQRSSVSLTWKGSGSIHLLFNNNQRSFNIENNVIMIFDNAQESAQFSDVPCNGSIQPT